MEDKAPYYKEVPGEWRYIKEHKTGGQGEIWVYQKPSGAYLALKTFYMFSLNRARLKRSLNIAARLKNVKYVIQIEAYGDDWYATRYYEKGSLCNRRFEEKEAAKIIYKIALALIVAHDKGIAHRDIKPENILLDDNDDPILIDWDIGKAEDHESVTEQGQLIGTWRYMAPEQKLAALDTSTSVDIYALGLTFETIVASLQHPGFESLIASMKHVQPNKRPTAKKVAMTIKAILAGYNAQPRQQLLQEDNSFKHLGKVALVIAALAGAYMLVDSRSKNQKDKEKH